MGNNNPSFREWMDQYQYPPASDISGDASYHWSNEVPDASYQRQHFVQGNQEQQQQYSQSQHGTGLEDILDSAENTFMNEMDNGTGGHNRGRDPTGNNHYMSNSRY